MNATLRLVSPPSDPKSLGRPAKKKQRLRPPTPTPVPAEPTASTRQDAAKPKKKRAAADKKPKKPKDAHRPLELVEEGKPWGIQIDDRFKRKMALEQTKVPAHVSAIVARVVSKYNLEG